MSRICCFCFVHRKQCQDIANPVTALMRMCRLEMLLMWYLSIDWAAGELTVIQFTHVCILLMSRDYRLVSRKNVLESLVRFARKSTQRKPKEDGVLVLKVFAFLPQMGRETIPFFPSISASIYLQAFLTSVSFSRLLPSSHHLLRLCHWRISLHKRLWQGFS